MRMSPPFVRDLRVAGRIGLVRRKMAEWSVTDKGLGWRGSTKRSGARLGVGGRGALFICAGAGPRMRMSPPFMLGLRGNAFCGLRRWKMAK